MKRRDLFKFAVPVAAATVVPTIVKAQTPATSVDPFSEMEVYRGFRIKWRGWFKPTNMTCLVGQWVAYNPHLEEGYGLSVYSSYPGATETFFPGQVFNTAVRYGQELPSDMSSPSQLEKYRADAKDNLIKYIDDHFDELVNIPGPTTVARNSDWPKPSQDEKS
jgi:hypothetical protein